MMSDPTTIHRAQWPKRLEQIDVDPCDIEMPNAKNADLDQDEEWFRVELDGQRQRLRIHDYDKLFAVPGLYERVVYQHLKCCSPVRVVRLLQGVLHEYGQSPQDLRVLDVGAGNGMVGDELWALGASKIMGVDIIQQARDAADRDRPEVYDDYIVADLTDLPERDEQTIRNARANCLTTVAALGFGDIPAQAFLKALDLVETPARLAFNIKQDFLRGGDETGFSGLITRLSEDGVIRVDMYQRYRHRLSIAGEPLYYVAMVATKQRDVPDEYLE